MKRIEALKLMAEGWELAKLSGTRGDAHIVVQKGGQGRGGEVRTVSWTVYEAMLKRNEIEKVEEPESQRKFWRTRYRLSAACPNTTKLTKEK